MILSRCKKEKEITNMKNNYYGYKLQGSTAYAKGKSLKAYPANSTIAKLKELGIKQIVYTNGSFISL